MYHYFRQWRKDGTWQQIHERLRLWVRVSQNREPSPSEAIMDSQTVETGTMVSKDVGFDSGKKIKGRKRHITHIPHPEVSHIAGCRQWGQKSTYVLKKENEKEVRCLRQRLKPYRASRE